MRAGGCGSGCGCGSKGEQAGGCQGGQGCGTEAKAGGCGCGFKKAQEADGPVVPITEAKVGDRTRCPVTNSVFVVQDSSPKAEHGGKTYHFCCAGCVNRFKADPQQFLET
jgi:YHS domain-containing protein